MDSVFCCTRNSKNEFILSKTELHHIVRVLRYKLPADIFFTEGKGVLYRGVVNSSGNILNYSEIRQSEQENINIYFGICDRKRMRFILEKCTELGVRSFHPIITENSTAYALNQEQSERIIIAAAKQSRRFYVPCYYPPVSLYELNESVLNNALFGALQGSTDNDIQTVLNGDINIFTGPPSGFSLAEEDYMISHNAKPFHLNTCILRTETFTIAVLSIIKYLQGIHCE